MGGCYIVIGIERWVVPDTTTKGLGVDGSAIFRGGFTVLKDTLKVESGGACHLKTSHVQRKASISITSFTKYRSSTISHLAATGLQL